MVYNQKWVNHFVRSGVPYALISDVGFMDEEERIPPQM